MGETQKSSGVPTYLVAALFIAFIFVFLALYGPKLMQNEQPSNQSQTNNSGSGGLLEQFTASLLEANELGIIMNVTGTESTNARYVYACGAGLAGSWGKLGKNLSGLHIYVFDDTGCTYSNPSLQNQTLNKTVADCAAENENQVRFDVRYGASYSIFTKTAAYLFVDETFQDECRFGLPQDESTAGIKATNLTANQTAGQAANQSGVITNLTGETMTTKNTTVLLQTSMGNITIELFSQTMPITAGNFEKLVKQGFYDGVIFHRVIDNFMIQGGDPTGTGAGGPGYNIPDEFTASNKNDQGTISMANAGPNTGGSQFFINLVNNNYLDSKHPVFGKVIEGMDVVDKIGKVQTDSSNRPLQNVTIISAKVV